MDSSRSLASTRFGAAFYAWLRGRWTARLALPSDVALALVASLAWAALYNVQFWHQAIGAMWQPTPRAALFVVSLFVVVVCLQALLLALVPTRLGMRIAASALFVIAALGSYFASAYGAVMNQDMMRNVIETDPAEVGGLISFDLLARVVVLGVIPAVLLWRIALPASTWRTRLRQRLVFIGSALAVCAIALFACSANYAVLFREHKPVRYALSPAAPIVSLAGVLAARERDPHAPLIDVAGNVQRTAAPARRPLVLFLVVGETARAANFQLGGYARATNPRLEAVPGLVYFDHATSCGTSTAISVPCMFSHLPRAQFDVDRAGRYTNLLDTLVKAGLDVEWRDNNAGCKGVCARVVTTSYPGEADATHCPNSYCYDEVMLSDLAARMDTLQRDTVVIFHAIGSHGPAYTERYPPQFETFQPACRSNELQRCSEQEIVNAYDNSIAYTDYILSRQIELLQANADRFDSVLLYASDHGESLGEQGIYLHGMPYSFAPRVQKEVPMLFWASRGYLQRTGLSVNCMRAHSHDAVSHDNVYHTVLGAMAVRDAVYDPQLDILALCRAATPQDHE
ncbi:MAG TPA: phosphoethanolamine--lipid A transferase [Steroidobacteraceae bacterium]|nr:phosphoethanolamine--lipid A transferase [Steroidobacteraceae bacterium]